MKACNGRLWGTLCDGAIEIRSLTKDKLEESLDILDKSFFLHESVCNATQINLPESVQARKELRELSRLTADDGVSLIAIEKSSGKPIAVSFNKIQYIPENGEDAFFLKFRKEQTHSPQAQSLMDFMIEVDGENDVFDKFNLQCFCELMFMATLPAWERKGIGRTLAKHSIELARELKQGKGLDCVNPLIKNKRPQAVTSLFTSKYSQKIGHVYKFELLNSVPYTRFKFNGKTYAERINPMHDTCEHVILFL